MALIFITRRKNRRQLSAWAEATNIAPSSEPERYGLIHALRGIAASWVVLFHASEGGHIDGVRDTIPGWMSSLFDLGSHGVAIFFVLSGFVIAHTLHGVALDLPYVGRFALRRSIRLDPAYWLSIAVVVMTGSIAALMKSEPVHLPGTGQIFAHMAYMQVFMGYAQLNFIT